MSYLLNKRPRASELLLDLLIWAVLSLFSMRLFLEIFNNPIVGRGNWHIAHVLWGGLFMLLSIIVFIVFSGRSAHRFASISAGLGWGLFIDEIGKYLTRDSNYWFRPAIIFIYISFILLFLLYRFLEKNHKSDLHTLWSQLLEDCQELVNHDLEIKEKKDLLLKIEKLSIYSLNPAQRKILSGLKELVESTPALSDKNEFHLAKFIAKTFHVSYTRLFKKKVVFYGLFIYSLWYIFDKLIDTIKLFLNPHKVLLLQTYYRQYDFFSQTDVYMITLKFIVEVIVALLFAAGLFFWLSKKTIRGIKFYQWGLLINIFIGSIFKFYFEQFSAVFSLILALIVWTWLDNYYHEKKLKL